MMMQFLPKLWNGLVLISLLKSMPSMIDCSLKTA